MSENSERHAVRLALERYAAHGAHAVVVDLDEVVHNHAHDLLRYDVADDAPCVALVVGRLLDEAVHLLRYGLAVGLLGGTGCHQANGHCGKNEDEADAPVAQRVALVLLTFLIGMEGGRAGVAVPCRRCQQRTDHTAASAINGSGHGTLCSRARNLSAHRGCMGLAAGCL